MMRFSLFVSVLALTSLGLAGCAADAEPTDAELDPNVAHLEPSTPVTAIDRTDDARQAADVSRFLPARPTDAARARQGETWSHAHLEGLTPRSYDARPSDSLIR